MTSTFRHIPDEAFGTKAIVRIRDTDAIVHNFRLFKAKADQTGTICAVVLKGDAYGLQISDAAPALYSEGVRHFFIEELGEGVELREILGYEDIRIYALGGLLHNEEKYFKEYRLIPCLNSLEQISRWNEFCKHQGRGSAIVHLDTHMNRLGLLDDDVQILSDNYRELTSDIEIEFLISHFYDIKDSDPTNCYRQLEILEKYRARLPDIPVSFACTDSVILLDNKVFNFDMIRPGIGLVGGAPNASSPISPDAKHTMEIYAKISQVKTVKKGQTIGYGAHTRPEEILSSLWFISDINMVTSGILVKPTRGPMAFTCIWQATGFL
jgi:alanine racemase